MEFKSIEEKEKFIESVNFLIDLCNRERSTTIGFYTTLNLPDGRTQRVPVEFNILLDKAA